MLLDYQNRLKNAYNGLPTQLKVKALAEGLHRHSKLDTEILTALDEKEKPVVKEMLHQYLKLGYFYHEKWIYNLKNDTLEAIIGWQMQAKMTLNALETAFTCIELIEKFNKLKTQDKYISDFCLERKQKLLEVKKTVQEVINQLETAILSKKTTGLKITELKDKIQDIEKQLGFEYLYKTDID